MDLRYSPEDEAFRAEVRAWIRDNLPEGLLKHRTYSSFLSGHPARIEWYSRLGKKGWLCASWPKEHGGPGWTMAQQVIFSEECSLAGAPGPDMGVSMVGPLIMEFGNDEQKQRYLPKIAACEEIWCQGYSEPNAGSDLANLGLRAQRDGDDYVLNGQKTWTSGAPHAHMIFLLVRTEVTGKKQQGISFLLCPMKAPGIRIQPIGQITDESHFYETFFDNVRVPATNRVGRENEGWTMAKRLLEHERSTLGGGRVFRKAMIRLIELAGTWKENGGVAVQDRKVRQRLAQLSMELDSLDAIGYRALTRTLRGEAPGPEASITKLFGSELYQRICDLALEIQGPFSQLWDDPNLAEMEQYWPKTAVGSRAISIFSGTSEIQRNIISERVLGMPR